MVSVRPPVQPADRRVTGDDVLVAGFQRPDDDRRAALAYVGETLPVRRKPATEIAADELIGRVDWLAEQPASLEVELRNLQTTPPSR